MADSLACKWFIGESGHNVKVRMENMLTANAANIPTDIETIGIAGGKDFPCPLNHFEVIAPLLGCQIEWRFHMPIGNNQHSG